MVCKCELLVVLFSIFFRAQHSTPHTPVTPAFSASLLLGSTFATGFPLQTPRLAVFTAVIANFCFKSTVISERKSRCHLLLSLAVDSNQLLAGADTLITRVV